MKANLVNITAFLPSPWRASATISNLSNLKKYKVKMSSSGPGDRLYWAICDAMRPAPLVKHEPGKNSTSSPLKVRTQVLIHGFPPGHPLRELNGRVAEIALTNDKLPDSAYTTNCLEATVKRGDEHELGAGRSRDEKYALETEQIKQTSEAELAAVEERLKKAREVDASAAAGSSTSLASGSRVRLHGLVGAKELNGLMAVVVAGDGDAVESNTDARIQVRLEMPPFAVKSIKRRNMEATITESAATL